MPKIPPIEVQDKTESRELDYALTCISCKKEYSRISVPVTPEGQICPDCIAAHGIVKQ